MPVCHWTLKRFLAIFAAPFFLPSTPFSHYCILILHIECMTSYKWLWRNLLSFVYEYIYIEILLVDDYQVFKIFTNDETLFLELCADTEWGEPSWAGSQAGTLKSISRRRLWFEREKELYCQPFYRILVYDSKTAQFVFVIHLFPIIKDYSL